jgi:hypothetical protein
MAQTHTATITEEGSEKVIRLPAGVPLQPGPVSVEIESNGGVHLKSGPENVANPWIELMDAMDKLPRDEQWQAFVNVMQERPMNQPPVERNLFPHDE